MEVSPILIPVLAMCIPLVAIIAGTANQMHNSRLKADQRMALLARGMAPQDVENFLRNSKEADRTPKDPLRSLANARRAAILLISTGVGLVLFFLLFYAVFHEKGLLAACGTGFIPLAIGIGFVVDYQMQKRELSRFGLEIDQDASPRP